MANRTRRWIVLGFLIGAIVSTVCAILESQRLNSTARCSLLLVPVYTAVWYVIRAVQLIRAAKMTASPLVMTLTSSLPFWAVGIWGSYVNYLSLPDQSGCFIVTAASRGHRKFVGPFQKVPHRGEERLANQQLATFWQFESLWCHHAPCSHAVFRCVYNKIGPFIARCIITSWLADVVYLALKPAELFARCVTCSVTLYRHLRVVHLLNRL